MSKVKFSIVAATLLFSNLYGVPFILESVNTAPEAGKNLVEAEARIKKDEYGREKLVGYYMYLAGGSDIKLSNNSRGTINIVTRRYHKPYADDEYRYTATSYKSFSYTTKGNQASKISIDLTNVDLYGFSLGHNDSTSSPIIGKNSNLFLKIASEKLDDSGDPMIKGLRVGFGEKDVEDEEPFMRLTDSKSSFNMDTKSKITIGSDTFDKIYLNKGAALNVKSTKDILFKNTMATSYITFSKHYYDNSFTHPELDCTSDVTASYRKGCNRIYSIGENATLNLDGQNITNEGYIFAKGAKGIVNINAKTAFVNKINDNKKDKGFKFEEDSNIEAIGTISAHNGGKVTIKSPSVINEVDSAMLNLGATFKIDGDFVNKGLLIAGQSSATSPFGYFDITGKTTLEDSTKLALAIYRDKPIMGNEDILFLKSGNGIEGFDKLKNQNIKLLRIKKEENANTKLIADLVNKTYDYNPNLSGENIFKVELSNANKELYYRLALTKEAISKSIDEIISDKNNIEKKRVFVQKLKNENKDAIDIINAVKATSKKFGPTVVSEYDKAYQGQKEAYGKIVNNINKVSETMKTFNQALDTTPIMKTMQFNAQMNIASRMVKFKNEPFAHAAPAPKNNILEPKIYDKNPATNTKKILSSNKGKRSLIIMADVEKELINKVKNPEQKTNKNNTRVLKSYEKRENSYSIDMPASFWFGGLNSKGDLAWGDLKISGFSLGLDKQYDNHILGAYLTAANAKTSFNKGAQVESKNIQVGAYGRVFMDDIELDLNGFYNYGSNKIKRSFTFYDQALSYESKGDVHSVGAAASLGYVLDTGNDFYVKPLVGINGFVSQNPEYKESGDLAFSKASGKDKSISALAAVELRKHFYNGNYLYIIPGVEQELSKSGAGVVKFSGYDKPFMVGSADKKQTYATLYGGTELKMTDFFLFNLNLGIKMSKDEKYYNANAGFKVKF